MTAAVVRYVPADPSGVTSVDRLRLYSDAARTIEVANVSPGVQLDDVTWGFTLPTLADGTYFARTTVTYADSTTQDDIDDTVTLPLPSAAQLGDPIAPWVTVADVTAAVSSASPAQAEAAAQTATEVLYALSGRRFPGLRVATLRIRPTLTGGGRELLPMSAPWSTVPGSRRSGGCCARSFDPLLHPIRSVVRMSIGGTDVPAEQIKVDGQSTIRLVRGAVSDPLAVNYYADENGTYSLWPGSCGCAGPGAELTITWGAEPPAGGLASAALLAAEFAKALVGEQCRLPGNVVTVNRQGVSIVLDPTALLDSGRVGIPFVDTWLAAVNPHKLKQEPLLWSPEMPLPDVVG